MSRAIRISVLPTVLVLLTMLTNGPTIHAQPASHAAEPQAQPYKATAGPWTVEVVEETWSDPSRVTDRKAREVPVRVYMPRRDDGKGLPVNPQEKTPMRYPVVVFSHGLGGSRDTYEYIGRHLASHGYLVIHPQHAGSDTPAIRELVRDGDKEGGVGSRLRRENRRAGRVARLVNEGTSDPANLVNRPLDIRFVIDQAAKHPKLGAAADMTQIAVAGHSFGSYTTMAVAGMRVNLPAEHGGPVRSFRDERVKAIIAMSPQGPGVMGVEEDGWSKIDLPALLITGSKDMGQGDRAVSWRLTPFEKLRHPGTQLLYIDGATHSTFSGAINPFNASRSTPRDVLERHVGYVKQTCAAFLDHHLRGDATARQWLAERAIEKLSDGECQLRRKKNAGESAPASK